MLALQVVQQLVAVSTAHEGIEHFSRGNVRTVWVEEVQPQEHRHIAELGQLTDRHIHAFGRGPVRLNVGFVGVGEPRMMPAFRKCRFVLATATVV